MQYVTARKFKATKQLSSKDEYFTRMETHLHNIFTIQNLKGLGNFKKALEHDKYNINFGKMD